MSLNSSPLLEFLDTQFTAAGGRMSFQEFMNLALYDPDFGYYTANIQTVGGRSADFSTWATLGDLGSGIASWLNEEIDHFQWHKSKINVIEVGGGDGSLANQVLRNLSWRTRRRIHYHMVDISGPLRTQQKQKLQKFSKVHWHGDIISALEAAEHRALIFSNELVDAFPANWFRWNGEQWQEVFVRFDKEKGLAEEFVPVDESISDLRRTGQRIEVHKTYKNWLADWSTKLNQGSILTIDYGHPDASEIYKNKLHGTMRGYFKQELISGGNIYNRFGKQDLTSDVNFSELKQWGEQLGWQTISLVDQLTFLQSQPPSTQFSPQEQAAAAHFYALHQRTLS